MDRIFRLFDPRISALRLFQGVELAQTNVLYHRFNGVFVDGSNEMLTVIVDKKGVIQGYEEGNLQVMEPTDKTPPHVRKQRSDKGVKRGKREKK